MEVQYNALLGGEVSSDIYFQNGDMVGKIESGVGMILSRWGVYVGEIANNQRSESGKQFGIWSNSAENGTWNLIRQEGDEWIYVESSSGGGRVSFASQEALTGHGVWRRY